MAETDWTRDEVRNVLMCIRTDTPEAMMEDAPQIIGWAIRVETRQAMLSLMKTLPPGVLECQWIDGDITLRISPDADVNELPDGTLEIITRGNGDQT